MDLYETVSYNCAKDLTEQYSTSFSASITLFPKAMRRHIYAIYGMVRVADEIVDTYRGSDAADQLEAFYDEVIRACNMKIPYSTNPIIHAFALTAKRYGITKALIDPFFDSMRTDLETVWLDDRTLETYIYGSAGVVGLMCLRVFTEGNTTLYDTLAPGAERLGNAYQKVNFLRDLTEDETELKRQYLALTGTASDTDKQAIIREIQADFAAAKPYLANLPTAARNAVTLSYRYYQELLNRLSRASLQDIRKQRIRVPDIRKLALYIKARAGK